MHLIKIKYPVGKAFFMLLLGIRRQYTAPGAWNELDRKQALSVCELIFSPAEYYVMLIRLSKLLTRMPLIAYNWISNQDKVYLSDHIKWVLEFDKQTLTKQLMPHHGKLWGPAENWDDLTVGEFYFGDRFFFHYLKNREEKYLDEMVKVLYREKKKGIRIPFNHAATITQSLSKWKLKHKLLVFVWWQGCRNEFVKRNPDLFKKTEGEAHPLGLYSVISDLSPKFGTINETMQTRLKDFSVEWKKAIHDAKPKKK